jgi:hypothetical protein
MSDKYLDDLDSGLDCGMPAAVVVLLWLGIIGCIGALLISVAILMTLTRWPI